MSDTTAGSHKPSDTLEVLSSGETPHKAVILVGGIHNNYTYFDSWKESLAAKDTVVMGFDHDHQSEPMSKGAHNLAEAIHALHERGIDDVTVVAHSMGGLVSKGALNELARTGESADFKHMELHTFGTPYGGFAAADLALVIPGSTAVSNAIGYPMGPEIGPHSDYMESLAQKWPDNMEFHVYQGTTDKVAAPDASFTKDRYADITSHADSMVLMEGFQHDEYVEADPQVLNAGRGGQVPGMDATELASAPQHDNSTLDAQQGLTAVSFHPDEAHHEETHEPHEQADMGAEMSM